MAANVRLGHVTSRHVIVYVLYMYVTCCLGASGVINGFDDTILFRLNWPGEDLSSPKTLDSENSIVLTTADNEKYQCTLPTLPSGSNDDDLNYSGPSALALLLPLFSQLSCSYRLEQYWTYELCHGKYIKQYHDEKDVNNPKRVYRQEYSLGEYDINDYFNAVKKQNEEKPEKINGNTKIPTKKIDGQILPYLEVTMTGGTVCDLNKKTRTTRVMYICYPESKNEIYSFEEVSTCEYDMVVLTPLLCIHPEYRLKENVQNDIHCRPLNGAPEKPLSLEKQELESLQFDLKRRKAKLLETIREKLAEEVKDEAAVKPSTPSDPKLVKDFLTGDYCLYGGSGWWKFEFCHGKTVDQYHEEKDGRRSVINLGKWNLEKHLLWLEQNPHKRPKKGFSQKQISHFYADGSTCDLNGRPRQVEVKLKCKESASSTNAVSLYLLEPKPCEYILVVESPILCNLVDEADENGLFQVNNIIK